VTLTVSAIANHGAVAATRFSNDGAHWSDWRSYAATAFWTLPAGDGLKKVYAQFMDAAGNLLMSAVASISLDAAPPKRTVKTSRDVAVTASSALTLNLSVTNGGSAIMDEHTRNESNGWSASDGYSPLIPWSLTAGDDTKILFVEFVDAMGNPPKLIPASLRGAAPMPTARKTWDALNLRKLMA